MNNDNKSSAKSGIKTNNNSQSYDEYKYDNELALEDYQAKQFLTRNMKGLNSKDIKDNYWLSETDYL